jgi:hypothetical protein
MCETFSTAGNWKEASSCALYQDHYSGIMSVDVVAALSAHLQMTRATVAAVAQLSVTTAIPFTLFQVVQWRVHTCTCMGQYMMTCM